VPKWEERPWETKTDKFLSGWRSHNGKKNWHKGNVFYTVFERILGNGRQEKKKYAAEYDIS